MTPTLDLGLISQAKKAINLKPRKYITAATLLAVIMQESGGCCYFLDLKPGSEYKMNIAGAMSFLRRNGDGTFERVTTGLNETTIRNLCVIDSVVGQYITNKLLQGKIAKFRFEPSYWERYPHLQLETRFLFSCSWGLPQFMGPNISKILDNTGTEFIRRWRADIGFQLSDAADFIEELLIQSKGDVNQMYRGYNSGDIHSQNESVIYRSNMVEKLSHAYELQIGR